MNICEAVEKALASDKYISRTDATFFKIKPTNTPECCLISGPDGENPCRGWQPQAEDLLSECWQVVN